MALCLLPLVALACYGSIAMAPFLAVLRWGRTAERAIDYSLQNTVSQVLYLPTARADKYKAKQAIDTFFVRAGDVLSAGTVLVGSGMLALRPGGVRPDQCRPRTRLARARGRGRAASSRAAYQPR